RYSIRERYRKEPPSPPCQPGHRGGDYRRVGESQFLAGWPIRTHARSSPHVLCAGNFSGHVIQRLDGILARRSYPPLATTAREAYLAKGLLRPSDSQWRELSAKVGLCLGKSNGRHICQKSG